MDGLFWLCGSALSEDREDDLVTVYSLNEDISDLIPPPDFPPKASDVLNVKCWEKLLEETFAFSGQGLASRKTSLG